MLKSQSHFISQFGFIGKSSPKPTKKKVEDDVNVAGSPQENEFVSDTFTEDGHISDEDLKKEMQMLGMEDDLKKGEGQ